MRITPNSFGSMLMESNDCHEPAGKSTGGQFCSGKSSAPAIPFDEVLELVNSYSTWPDEDTLQALDEYGLNGRGETEAQRFRRETYGGEGQMPLPGEWQTPPPEKPWADLSVPERLDRLGVEYDTIEPVAGTGADPVYIINGQNQRLVLDADGGSTDIVEWVNDTDPEGYVTLDDYNAEFWEGGGETFHATPEENVEDILRDGLSPMNKTRGLSNRGTGAAVFTSSDIELIQGSYGPSVFRIDLDAMKRDGYMPEVGEEEPIVEMRAKQALAHKMGIDNYEYEVEHGIDESTIIIYGHIPPKYLSLVED